MLSANATSAINDSFPINYTAYATAGVTCKQIYIYWRKQKQEYTTNTIYESVPETASKRKIVIMKSKHGKNTQSGSQFQLNSISEVRIIGH